MRAKVGAILLGAMVAVGAQAETFGTGANQFSIDFVNIGNAGNVGDTQPMWDGRTGYGSVEYDYRIGKYEITIDQFAKARAADNSISNGNEGYWNTGILGRSVGTGAPAGNLSVYEAMRFCNWLTTGNAYSGAYQFDERDRLLAIERDAALETYGMVYLVPNENEWYKAAYYKPINDGSYSLFANGSDDPLTVTHGTSNGWNYYNNGFVNGAPNYTWETGFGAEEQNGTYDMMGNVWEWNESAHDDSLGNMASYRVIRGGNVSSQEERLRSTMSVGTSSTLEGDSIGFRVVAIPEPSSIAMIGLVSGCAVFVRKRFMI